MLKVHDNTPWVLCGDFNITMTPEDRSTQNMDWRTPLQFCRLASNLGLLKITLQGRHFTWSNERQNPVMARLDRFLILTEWNARYPNSTQQTLPNTSSDHCPILYTAKTGFNTSNFFRFENMWLRSPKCKEIVTNTWQSTPMATTAQQLNQKLLDVQRNLK